MPWIKSERETKWCTLTQYTRDDGITVHNTIATYGEIKEWCVGRGTSKHCIPHRWRFKTAENAMKRVDERIPLK